MLHIILLILKILGIILLCVLALAVLILCAVLFVAVTYRVKVERKETLQVSAVGGWLFRALSVHYTLDEANGWKQDLRIRVFGITILNLFEEKKPKKKKKKPRRDKPDKEESRDEPAVTTPGVAEAPDDPAMTTPGVEEASDEPVTTLPAVTEAPDESAGQTKAGPEKSGRRTERDKKPPLTERIRRFFSKLLYAIRGICDKIKETKRNLGETVQRLREQKDTYLEFWNLEEHKRARGAVYKELRYLWKKARPRRIEGEVRFGFDDPSVTGMCMGALSVLYAWYPKKFYLNPDFDQKILEGKLLIKGHIRLYAAALILCRAWFNKDIRHMYEHWQEL